MNTPAGPERLNFANGFNINVLEDMYAKYKSHPDQLDSSWQAFFAGFELAQGPESSHKKPGYEALVEAYINAYRRLGHLNARLSPLEYDNEYQAKVDLSPKAHGLQSISPNEPIKAANLPFKEPVAFTQIESLLRETYCSFIGADFRETHSIEACVWLQEMMEGCRNKPQVSKDQRLGILNRLVAAEGFERFLQDRYLGQKRFSVEGLESLLPLLHKLCDEAAMNGVEEVMIGMAHRGRLNVLTNLLAKPPELLLKEFEGTEFNPYDIDGDVKYHKGFSSEITTDSGKKIRLHLSPNPSHLEAVNPVVEGLCRARQKKLKDPEGSKVLPLLLHGDASFIGQGLVTETLNFAHLEAYQTGGTIHIITNNQVGFTTDPEESRSCTYSSDIAKVIRAPVLHVNADDPEAVIWTSVLAASFRAKFKSDIVIDLIGYRRHGHNETDEPSFTQPLMYKKIKDHPSVHSTYAQKLIRAGELSESDWELKKAAYRERMQKAMELVRAGKSQVEIKIPKDLSYLLNYERVDELGMLRSFETKLGPKKLRELAQKINSLPEGFKAHPKIEKWLKSRLEMLEGEGDLDWGLGEALAFASLANEGHHVRLSGQDCRRGTFSHRHAVIRDYDTNKSLNLLNQIGSHQGEVEVINSPLSEQGVMGFEFGYSVGYPEGLVLWEAQFGDFANGAQIIIDQFIVASEAKWKQTSGLVLLLPHGYEGQGPEHSSARPERFLQLCGSANIQVMNLTTPAQYFHALRRQIKRPFRKPLVIMTPKSLLRHPMAKSKIKEFSEGGFQEMIDDQSIKDPKSVTRLIFCTGKLYYELLEEQIKQKQTKVALVRVEQIYPFHEELAKKVIARYPNLAELFWVQEEPSNMGAWTFVRHRLKQLLPEACGFKYLGRQSSGTTAEGSQKAHAKEQARIISEAIGI